MNPNHFFTVGLKAAKEGPPVPPHKNAFVAFLAGFIFGPIGCGLYLESWEDFLVPLLILIGASIFTAGVAAPIAWAFSGCWAAMRVSSSNDDSQIDLI